jgi:hypothetical protein
VIVSEALSSTLAAAREELHARGNVIATGIGFKVTDGVRTDELSIICSVTEKVPAAALTADDLVPSAFGGFPTDVIATGEIRALRAPTGRWRPAPGGVSVGHARITAGTLGCIVRRGEELLLLSNNHVFADSNAGQPGDPILQPGVIDGGTLAGDQIAVLDRFVPIAMSGEESSCAVARGTASFLNGLARLSGSQARLRAVSQRVSANLVDAATARPIAPDLVTSEVLGIGAIGGTARAELGMRVRKSGRTTGLTMGEIEQVEVTVDVAYGPGQAARFTDQVMAGAMSQGGDSGSAIVNLENNLVGLLFAGSNTTTIINRIQHVFDALDIGL